MTTSRWLVLWLLAGCGDDAGVAPDAAPAPVTGDIAVVAGLPGASVVFTDATDATQVVSTDATGRARARVTGPTAVTVVNASTPSAYRLTSVLGAEPGDELQLASIPYTLPSQTASITVSFTPVANTRYRACGTCGCSAYYEASPISLGMDEGCAESPATVVLLAHDGTDLVGHGQGTVHYDPDTGAVLSLAATQAPRDLAFTLTGIHDGFANIVIDVEYGAHEVLPGGTSLTRAVKTVDDPPQQVHVVFVRDDSVAQHIVHRVAAGDDFVFDGAIDNLPLPALPTYDPLTQTIHAPVLPGPREPDLVLADVDYETTDAAMVRWIVFAAEAGDIALPVIPAAVANVQPAATQELEASAEYFEVEAYDGFAEARLEPIIATRAVFAPESRRAFWTEARR